MSTVLPTETSDIAVDRAYHNIASPNHRNVTQIMSCLLSLGGDLPSGIGMSKGGVASSVTLQMFPCKLQAC
jgi:hypothetical protein